MSIIFFVYKLTFQNGMLYIGASRTDGTGSYTVRYRKHAIAAGLGRALPIYDAWREIGPPILEILSKHESKEEAAISEINAISKFRSGDESFGYNIQAGGNGSIAFSSERHRKIMQEKVWGNEEWRKKISDAQNSPEFKAIASARTKLQMANGGAAHLAEKFKGRGDIRSAEGKEAQRTKTIAYLNTAEGKASARRGYEAFKANPENVARNQAALDVWRKSDANKANILAAVQKSREKCSRPVRDMETGITYPSQRAMAQALGVSDALISRRVKAGLVARC